ncbi:hypothetical protein CLU79DRAFT_748400 [Phycomyces nitens]|nr:hypothetical protein CLU79DRAFT_748400 [Phycomyces nitens]
MSGHITLINDEFLRHANTIEQLSNRLQADLDLFDLSPYEMKDCDSYVKDRVTLFQFLRASRFDPHIAHEQLLDTVRWRINMSIGKLSYHHFMAYFDTPCIVFDKLDKMGRPVIVLYPRNFPFLTGPTDASKPSIGSLTCLLMEVTRQYMHDLSQLDQEGSHLSRLISQCIILVDMSEAPFLPVNAELIMSIREILDKRFPGSIQSVHVLNFAWAYQGLWQMVKFLLSDNLKHIIRFNSEELQRIIAEDDLERILGSSENNPWINKSEEIWKKYGYHPDIVSPKKKSRIRIRDLFPDPSPSFDLIPTSSIETMPAQKDDSEHFKESNDEQSLQETSIENNKSQFTSIVQSELMSQDSNISLASEAYAASAGHEEQNKSLIRLAGTQEDDLETLQQPKPDDQELDIRDESKQIIQDVLADTSKEEYISSLSETDTLEIPKMVPELTMFVPELSVKEDEHLDQTLSRACVPVQTTSSVKTEQDKEELLDTLDDLYCADTGDKCLEPTLKQNDKCMAIDQYTLDEIAVARLVCENAPSTDTHNENDCDDKSVFRVQPTEDMNTTETSLLLYKEPASPEKVEEMDQSMFSESTYNDESALVDFLLDSDVVKVADFPSSFRSEACIANIGIETDPSQLESPTQHNEVIPYTPRIGTNETTEPSDIKTVLSCRQLNELILFENQGPENIIVIESVGSCDINIDERNISQLSNTPIDLSVVAKDNTGQNNSPKLNSTEIENEWNTIPDFSNVEKIQRSIQQDIAGFLTDIEFSSAGLLSYSSANILNVKQHMEDAENMLSSEDEKENNPSVQQLLLLDDKNGEFYEDTDASIQKNYHDEYEGADIIFDAIKFLPVYTDNNGPPEQARDVHKKDIGKETPDCYVFTEKIDKVETEDSSYLESAVKVLGDMIANIDDMLAEEQGAIDPPNDKSPETTMVPKDKILFTLESIEEEEADVNDELVEKLEYEYFSTVEKNANDPPIISVTVAENLCSEKACADNAKDILISKDVDGVSDTTTSSLSNDDFDDVPNPHKSDLIDVEPGSRETEQDINSESNHCELAMALSNISNFLEIFTEETVGKSDDIFSKEVCATDDLSQSNEPSFAESTKDESCYNTGPFDREMYSNEVDTLLNIVYENPCTVAICQEIYDEHMESNSYKDETDALMNIFYEVQPTIKENGSAHSKSSGSESYTDEIGLMMNITYDAPELIKVDKSVPLGCYLGNSCSDKSVDIMEIDRHTPLSLKEDQSRFSELPCPDTFADEINLVMKISYDIQDIAEKRRLSYSSSIDTDSYKAEAAVMRKIVYNTTVLRKNRRNVPSNQYGFNTYNDEINAMMRIMYDFQTPVKETSSPTIASSRKNIKKEGENILPVAKRKPSLVEKAVQTSIQTFELDTSKERHGTSPVERDQQDDSDKNLAPKKITSINLDTYADEVHILESIKYDIHDLCENNTVNPKDMDEEFYIDSNDANEKICKDMDTSEAATIDMVSLCGLKACTKETSFKDTVETPDEFSNKSIGIVQNPSTKTRVEELTITVDTIKEETLNCISKGTASEDDELSKKSIREKRLTTSNIIVDILVDSDNEATTREPITPITEIYDKLNIIKTFPAPDTSPRIFSSTIQDICEPVSSEDCASKDKDALYSKDIGGKNPVYTKTDLEYADQPSSCPSITRENERENTSVNQNTLPLILSTGPLPLPSPQQSPRITPTELQSDTTKVAHVSMEFEHDNSDTSSCMAIIVGQIAAGTEAGITNHSSRLNLSKPRLCGPLWPLVHKPMPFTTWLGIYTGLTVYKSFIHTHNRPTEMQKACKCMRRISSSNRISQGPDSTSRFQSHSLPARFRGISFFQDYLPSAFTWPYKSSLLDVTKQVVRATYPRYSLLYWIVLYLCIRGPVEIGLSRLISQSVESPKKVATITLSIAATITAITSSSLAYFANS